MGRRLHARRRGAEDLKGLLPKSLVGQIALVMALALLVAQAVNFALILSERQRLSLAEIEGPAINRFVSTAQQLGSGALEPEDLGRRGSRRSQIAVSAASAIAGAEERNPNLEQRVRAAANAAGVPLAEVRAAGPVDVARSEGGVRSYQHLVISARLADGRWLNARLATPRRDPWLVGRLAGATLLLYLIVLGATIWIALRLARPLRDLTAAAQRFDARGTIPPVEPRGPADLRRAIEAFNAMSLRVAEMLQEKDRMLGAIGHDMRTPLASMRIRAESMEPEEEREKLIATIEEMTAMLDDTLVLARSGRSREQARAIDVAALADTVVEEFACAGRKVTMLPSTRQVASVRPNLLRRAIRNLIDNSVKYAGAAEVAVGATDKWVAIQVKDRGPGIAEAELDKVQEAFHRIESSRNRETGGSGLGLTIARAVALNHGGSLELRNRRDGGLVVRLLVPRA